ncbi:MAG: deoxynucleoside kinase [Saprospiraceae bacterium]|nr:deoxynucleoside kinase [Saprospiraceae bacterium]
MNSPFPYNYICIEGNIGAGKTTFCKKIQTEFECNMILEQFDDNPFLPLFYKEPERFAFTVELFFMTESYKQMQANLLNQNLFSQFTISDYAFVKTLLFAKKPEWKKNSDCFKTFITYLTRLFQNLIFWYTFTGMSMYCRKIKKEEESYETEISDDYLTRFRMPILNISEIFYLSLF